MLAMENYSYFFHLSLKRTETFLCLKKGPEFQLRLIKKVKEKVM